MNAIRRWWVKRRLRRAIERYAYLKAKKEAMQHSAMMPPWSADFVNYMELCGKVAMYEERVEQLFRDANSR